MDIQVKNGDHTIAARVEGPEDAPVLLLAHPLGANKDVWAPQAAAFTDRYRVVTYDARGHGGSAVPAGESSIEDLGSDAIAVLDHVGALSAAVAGVSLGGQLAMWLGLNKPERVERLIIANTGAKVGSAEIWDGRAAAALKDGMAPIADATIERWFTAPFLQTNPDVVAPIKAMIANTPAQGYATCCAALRDADMREDLGGMGGVPVLVIVGKEDAATPPDLGRAAAAAIPGAELAELDCGHLSNVEQAEAFTAAMRAFLAG